MAKIIRFSRASRVFTKGLGLILMVFFVACNSQQVAIETMRPAEISVANEIQTLLLVDRTKVDRNDWLQIGEGILTGELPFEDRAAAQESLNQLKNKLQESPRYRVLIASERLSGNSFSAAFPQPLSWDEQERLLRKYEADALVTMEIMDSDFIITNGKRRVTRTVGTGDDAREVEVDEYYAEGVGNLKIGYRFYYPQRREIIDQQLISETNTWQASADSKAAALAALIDKSRATRELAGLAGYDYAYKIAPLPVMLQRNFYVKAKDSEALERGARLAEVDDWQAAIDVWETGLTRAGEKDAGRMALNIAVAYEVLGDFEKAREWAQKAYANYGNKRARAYVGVIQERVRAEQLVREQMLKP